MGGMRNACKIFVRKAEGTTLLGRARRKSNFQEVGWEGVDWVYLAQDREQWRAVVRL
jgi:hypothetical protein